MTAGSFLCLAAGAAQLVLAACHPAPPAAQPIAFDEGDSSNVYLLESQGRRSTGRHVVVLAPPDSMSGEWQKALTDSLDRGVSELRRMIGAWPWQRIGDRPIRYYLVPQRMISHASGKDVVFISMFHVNNGHAPYLHEAVHELVAPPPPFFFDEYADTVQAEAMFQATPVWLAEGMADVLALRAAAAVGNTEGDVFAIGGLEKADSTCAARLAGNEYRSDLLRALGGTGSVDALYTTDRVKVAPTFYACSQSMAKFLVELIGVERAVALFPAIKSRTWTTLIERDTGMPLATMRARWQARIGLADSQ